MATQKLGMSALLAAVYSRLENDADTTAYSVYNHAPRTATMPYISFGAPMATESRRISTRDTKGEAVTFTVHVWSDQAGDKQCADIMAHVVDAICGTALSVTGYYVPLDVTLEYSDITVDLSDTSRPVRHGVCRFRVDMAPSS